MTMAPRANWKGYLKLSLVSCAVALYPASSSSSRISFNTLNKKTGNKVKRIYIDPHTGDIEKFVPRNQIDPRYMDAPYYIAPEDRVAQEPFAVIRDAMRSKEVVGIGRVVISRRER